MRNLNQKISKPQMEALTLIANSDHCDVNVAYHTAVITLKVNGMSRQQKINWATFDVLKDLGLVEVTGQGFYQTDKVYWLSEKGFALF